MNRYRAAIVHERRVHRRAAKIARKRNAGHWSGYDGEQKHGAIKAAFKQSNSTALNVPPFARDSGALQSHPTIARFLPHWLALRPKPVEPIEEAA